MPEPLQIGLVIFPKVTQLDLTGPVQVFSSVPGAKVHLIWKRIEPVASDSVLTLTPTIIHAGVKSNSIPATAIITCDVRTVPGQDAEYVKSEMAKWAGIIKATGVRPD